MRKKQGFLALLLSGALIASSMPMAFAAEFSDMPQDWATVSLEKAVANGLFQGADGKIMPDANLSRAELATIMTRAFAANEMADISTYTDIPADAWYEGGMAKAVQMGILFGSDGALNPTDAITRQEAFCVLARAFSLTPSDADAVDGFADGDAVASWARTDTAAMIEAGFVQGNDSNNLNPTQTITRKEFAVLMDRMVAEYISEAGTVEEVSQGSVMINTPDVILKDVTVDGDLIIGDGVGDGDVTLDNVTVEGDILVRGGGENTFRFLNNSSVKGHVHMNKCSGQESTRFLGDNTVTLPQINVLGASKGVVLQDVVVEHVNVTAAEAPVVLNNATVDKIAVASNKVVLDIVNSVVETLVSAGSGTSVKVDADTTVSSAVVSGDDTSIAGEGKVSAIETSAANTKIETVDSIVTATETATGTVASGTEVKPDTAVTTKPDGVIAKPTTSGSSFSRPRKAFDAKIIALVEAFDDCVVPLLDGEVNMTPNEFQYVENFISSSIVLCAQENELDVTGLKVTVKLTNTNGLSATLTQSGYTTKVIPLNHVTPKESFTVTFDLQGGGLKEPKKTTQVVQKVEKAVLLTEEDFSFIPPDETGKAQLFDNWVDAEGVVVAELTVTETTTLYATYKADPRSIAQQRIDKARTAINNSPPTPITVVDGQITKVNGVTVSNTSSANDLDTLLKGVASNLITATQAWGVYSEINATPATPFTSVSMKLIYSDEITGVDSTVTDTVASLACNPTEYYTITFEIDEKKGSIVSNAKTVVQKGDVLPLPTIIETPNDTYHYVGWTADGGETVITAGDSPVATATTTYTAVFEQTVIEITEFDISTEGWFGKTMTKTVVAPAESTPEQLATVVFTAWGVTPPSTLSATAGEETVELDVVWTAEELKDSDDEVTAYVLTATATTAPDGYVFVNDAATLTVDYTLDAATFFEVTFNVDESYVISGDTVVIIAKDTVVPTPVVELPDNCDMAFIGWSTESSDEALTTLPLAYADITYTAVFTDVFTVTFSGNAEDVIAIPEAQRIISGEYATEPVAPTKAGHTFAGWYTDADCTEGMEFNFAETGISVHTILYAKWTVA